MTIKEYVAFMEDLSSDIPADHKYNFYMEYLLEAHPHPRVLLQRKCIDKFKWEEAERVGNDISKNHAGMLWVERGLAEKFERLWNKYKDENMPCCCAFYTELLAMS